MVSDCRLIGGCFCARAVLILVLMEYGLWPMVERTYIVRDMVLILVLMEYGLWRWLQGDVCFTGKS